MNSRVLPGETAWLRDLYDAFRERAAALFCKRDRWFESGSLQRRVNCEPARVVLSDWIRTRGPAP
jgi:hypothetical protein